MSVYFLALLFSDSNQVSAKRSIHNYQLDQHEVFTSSTVSHLCTSLKALAVKMDSNSGPLAKMMVGMSLSFFRSGIQPVWENEWNKNGGRILFFPKEKSLDQIFLALTFLLAGDSLLELVDKVLEGSWEKEEGTFSGVVASRREGGDRIEVWLAGKNPETRISMGWVDGVKEVLKKELGLDKVSGMTFYFNYVS